MTLSWDQRFAGDEYFYGREPNAFVASVAAQIPAGPVLCLAEGEGRNAVHLAGLGHVVTALDQSPVGLAKAARLANKRGVSLTTLATDLAHYTIAPGAWAGIVATFAHFPPPLRRAVHAQVVAGLRPGGVFILEAYTPAQLAFGTGGPKDLDLLMTLDTVRAELAGLELIHARECERDVIEGRGHTGRAAVLQILARRPTGAPPM